MQVVNYLPTEEVPSKYPGSTDNVLSLSHLEFLPNVDPNEESFRTGLTRQTTASDESMSRLTYAFNHSSGGNSNRFVAGTSTIAEDKVSEMPKETNKPPSAAELTPPMSRRQESSGLGYATTTMAPHHVPTSIVPQDDANQDHPPDEPDKSLPISSNRIEGKNKYEEAYDFLDF